MSTPRDPDAPDVPALIARLRAGDSTDDAIDQLAALGEPAIEPLLTTLHSPAEQRRVRELAAIALGHIAPRGVTCLLALLDGDDDGLADLAAWGLRWPPRCSLAQPILENMLRHPEARRRLRGLRGLQYIGVDLAPLDPRILEHALADVDSTVRDAARKVLDGLPVSPRPQPWRPP